MKTILCYSVYLFFLILVSADENKGPLRPSAQNTTAASRRLIAGGSVVPGSDFPFFALLFGRSGRDDAFFCGGVLIARDVVLTAASCFNTRNQMSFVRLGGDTNEGGEEIDVDEIIINPRYRNNKGILEYDFAVIKLKERANTRPARVNTNPLFPNMGGTLLETLGYGEDENGDILGVPVAVDLEFVTIGTCQSPDEGFGLDVSSNLHECTTAVVDASPDSPSLDEGPCDGDQGGPLLFDGNIVIGIYSFGSACAGDKIAVFSKVSSNLYWILTQAGLPIPTPEPTPQPTPRPTRPYHKPSYPHPPHPAPNHAPHPLPTKPSHYPDKPWCHPQHIVSSMLGWTGNAMSVARDFFVGSENPDEE